MDLTLVTHPVLLVINMLAMFRLARLVTRDAFPLGPLRLRIVDWANDHWGPLQRTLKTPGWVRIQPDDVDIPRPGKREDGRKVMAYDGQAPIAYLVTCPWCVSMYLSPAVALIAATGLWWLWIAVPLAMSAVTGALASLTD